MSEAVGKRKRDAAASPPLAEGLQEFQKAVQELKNKAAVKIVAITSLADTHQDSADQTSQILCDELASAAPSRVQPLVSVVDSILKKVGQHYKQAMAARLPACFHKIYGRTEGSLHVWLGKMVYHSWRKYELLPLQVLDALDAVLRGEPLPVIVVEAVAQDPPQAPEATAAPVAAKEEPAAVKAEPQEAAPKQTEMTQEMVERRLTILTKIINRGQPGQEELQEIMKVPEIRKAIVMQQQGHRQQAIQVLSAFKQELEEKVASMKAAEAAEVAARPRDPRQQQQEAKASADPRQTAAAAQQPRPLDPRELAAKSAEAASKPQDPRERAAAEARKRSGEAPDDEPGSKQAKASEGLPDSAEALSDEDGESKLQLAKPTARQILQGLPSIGFSESWLRQFMQQMPTKPPPPGLEHIEAPCVGRKVLGASGDQMVYVDELSPNEVTLLMQLVFLLEEKLRRSGAGQDAAQRLPHTFSYLQVDPAIDVMLKRFFNESPFQCEKTGLRFATQDKLRLHTDEMFKRKAQAQQKQRGTEARGWMESVSEWVGNRDLVFGAALFRLGEGDESQKVQEERLRAQQLADAMEEDDDGAEPGCGRWICPLDERRSVCPMSGDPLQRVWSPVLNDWAFNDVVAAEVGSATPVRFPQGGPMGPSGLSETAVLFKRSCFFGATPGRRQEALEECRRACPPMAAPKLADLPAPAWPPRSAGARPSVGPLDPGLKALEARPVPRPFF